MKILGKEMGKSVNILVNADKYSPWKIDPSLKLPQYDILVPAVC